MRSLAFALVLASGIFLLAGCHGGPTSPDSEPSQPPINILVAVHIEPFLDEFDATYGERREELYWLRDTALTHGAKLTVASNGEFMEFVEDLGDEPLIGSYLDAGFNWGTHIHPLSRKARHLWIVHSPDAPDSTVRRIWSDNIAAVEAVIRHENDYGVAPYQCRQPLMVELIAEHGFSIMTMLTEPAGELAYEEIGHYPWNPFRPCGQPGNYLKEDLSQHVYVMFPHLPQLGGDPGPSGPRTLGTNQKYFLMCYLEWLHHLRAGLPEKVWVFGIATHDCYNKKHHEEILEMLDWLEQSFVGHTTPDGHTIARYASATEVAEEFFDWEARHPDESSFSWQKGEPYPYTYSAVPELLRDAEYDQEIQLGETLACYSFTRERDGTIYLVWSWSGQQTVDLSSLMPGEVIIYDGLGDQTAGESSSVHVTEEPVFVEAAGGSCGR